MATLTLKNIPEELHALLKESAVRNRRSLTFVDHALVDRFKRQGRT